MLRGPKIVRWKTFFVGSKMHETIKTVTYVEEEEVSFCWKFWVTLVSTFALSQIVAFHWIKIELYFLLYKVKGTILVGSCSKHPELLRKVPRKTKPIIFFELGIFVYQRKAFLRRYVRIYVSILFPLRFLYLLQNSSPPPFLCLRYRREKRRT